MKCRDFAIREVDSDYLDAYIALLEEAAVWLWRKGVWQWRPGEHRTARLALQLQIERGALILAFAGERPAGGCLLAPSAPPCWPDAPATAMYLSGLVAARFAAGKDLGGRILDEAMDAVQRRGKKRLRLDCWDGNDFLKSYYRAHGFTDMGRAQEGAYWVRLFERRH